MKDLLTRALDAHGGLSRWREIEAFQLQVSIGGGLWRLKGLPDGLRDVTLRIQAHRPIVTITPFGGEARTGHFTPDRVWVEDAHGGVVEERAVPRASFAGHVLTTRWDKLQELYFVSYALWNYLATPFMFTEPGFETREIGPHEENGERWHRLLVKYPPSIPTHCAEQVLYFNGQGLLQRMDYSADVVADMVAGCRLSLLLRSYPVRWHRHSDPPPGGQPHSEGCSALGSDGSTVTNEVYKTDSEYSKGEKQ